MKNMIEKHQLLRDPNVQPTKEVLSEALGEAYAAYVQFVSRLENHEIQLEWRYYTDGKAWLAKGLYKWVGVRGGQNEVTVFWLSIWDGFFRVNIYVPEKSRETILDLPIDHKVKQMIVESNQMGKLKFFPIVFNLQSDEMFDAVDILLEFKKGK